MTPPERALAAECRAVEDGHHAVYDIAGRCFTVVSDTYADVRYTVRVHGYAGSFAIYGTCTCPAGRRASASHPVPCKHVALVLRRGEREGWASNVDGRWVRSGALAVA